MADYQQYLAILELEPNNAQALQALEVMAAGADGLSDPAAAAALETARKTHRDRGELELVARLFDVELAASKDKTRRADLLMEKGKLLADEFLNEDAAVECFNRVLELRPDDENAQEVLAHIGLVRENWEKIVKKYLDEAKVATDRQLTTGLYLSVAETYARYRREAPEVEQYLRKALEVEPRNRRAAMHLERLLRNAGRWEELATFLEQRVDAGANKEERVQALLGLADLAKSRINKPQLAIDTMKKVLALDPTHPRAMQALVEAYSAEENWQALVKLYEGALKGRRAGKPEDELAMALQIAMIYWKRLKQMDAAEEFFRRVRKVDPAHEAMVEFYRTYHKDRGEGSKLLQVLQAAQKAEQDPQRRGALSVEMAGLAEKEVGNPEKAIDSWKAILRQDPKNQEARGALKRLYQRTEKWNALLELLKEEVEAIPTDSPEGKAARVERLLEVVAIYRDRLNLDVMVINTFNNILALQPDNAFALDSLATKYEQLGRWNDLTNVLQKKADAPSTDKKVRVELLRRIAALWTDRFGNHAQAVKPLEDLLALDPSDAESSGKLKEIYTKRRQWRALLDLLGREAGTLPADKRRGHLADMAGLAAEKLGDTRVAISIWNRILEDDTSDALALASLASLYEREKRWPALAEIYHRQRAAVGDEDPRAATAILERLGSLYAEKLEAPALAAEAFQDILRIQPGHTKALRILRELHAQAGDMEALEQLYGKLGAWDELVEVLHGVADRAPENDKKLAVLERAARLAESKLGADKAAKAHERILMLDPHNLTAARALVPIYRKGEKWARLLSTYEVLLAHAETRDEKLALHVEIRKLCEEKIGSKAMAFQWCASAYELVKPSEPEGEQLLKDLMRLGAEADAWERVAEIIKKRVDSDGIADGERTRLLRELGRIRNARLHQPEEARAAWEQVLKLAPDDPEAMTALEDIATQQARWPDLLQIFHRRAELEKDVAKKQELLFKIAFIEEERVVDLEAAARTYQKIVQLDPKSARALRALGKVQHARGDAGGLVRTLELELEHATETDQRVQLLLRLGALYEEKLGDRRKAVDRYTSALEKQPANRAVHTALERFLAPAAEERVEVARLMAPVYERAEDASKLAVALEIIRHAEPDDASKLVIDRRLIGLYAKKLKDPLNAYEVAARVLALQPEDAENRALLSAFAGELSAYDDLVNHFEKAFAKAQETKADASIQRELAIELAEIYDEKLQKTGPAEAAWRRVLDLDAGEARAYDALERMLRAAGRWDDLREVLERRAENTLDSQKKKEILLSLCDLYEGVLDNATGATESYRRILELDPGGAGSMRAFKALERLYDGAQKWPELEDLLGKEIAFVQGREQVTLTYRRAELRAEKLADKSGAVDLAEEVLQKDAGFIQARKLLETLFNVAELRLRIARLLGPIYETDGQWKDLVRMLRGEREFANSAADASALLAKIAMLQEERLADEKGAFDTWIEALRTDPEEKETRAQAERLARRLDRWSDATAAWEAAIAAVPEGDLALRGALYSEVAHMYDEAMGDAGRATKAYRALLEVDPGNVEAVRPAAAALERLHDEQEQWPELIEILRRQADWAEQPQARFAAFMRIAKIQEEKLADPLAALTTWKEILGEDGENRSALDALERLHGARGESRDLVEILRKRAELTPLPQNARDKAAILTRVAVLQEKELKDTTEATTAYLEILDFLPDDTAALGELARLYRAGERWGDLLEIDERRLTLSTDAGQREALRFELGEILRDRLSRNDEALERFREILAENPEHEGARAAVEKFLDDQELRLRAAEVLQPIYHSGAEHQKLVGLYELEAKHHDDPRERLVRLRKIAVHQEKDLGDKDAAFDALCRAARDAVSEPEFKEILAEVTRLAMERERIRDLLRIYKELAPDVLDAELQRRIYLDIADLSRGKLHDLDTARDYYKRVLDAQPDDVRANEALEMICRETQDFGALREILQRKADRAEHDPDLRREALVEIAILCEEKLQAGDDAVAAWEQVLEMNAGDSDASKALERLYTERERWVELAELLEKRLGFAEDLAEAVELRHRLGELHEKQLTDPDKAVENYTAALGGDPTHARSVEAMERFLDDPAARMQAAEVLEPLYIARQDWPKLIRITEIRLDSESDPALRLALTKRIARLYEESLEDFEGAFKWYGKVFREGPQDRAPRDQLMRLAQILDKWEGLANIYQEFLDDETGEEDHVRDVARQLAEICDRRLNDVERARAAYRRVLQGNPEDPAFNALETMLVRAARWFALIESYNEAIDAAVDPNRRKEMWSRIARVQETKLTAVDKAIDAYRSILEIDLDDEGANAQLDRLYQESKRWIDLSELLTTRVDRAKGPMEANALRVRLADVLEQKLNETGAAIDQYEHVLAADPGYPAAIQPLERLVVNTEHKQRIAGILEPIYRKHDWWQKLVIILDAQLEFMEDQASRIDRLREIAKLHETRGGTPQSADLALRALSRAWREDVSNEDVYTDLVRLAEKQNAWDKLVETLDAGVEGIYDYDLAARILSRLGQIEEEKRGRRPAAIAAYKRVLEVKEDDGGALDALERLYATERMFEPLVQVLEKKQELSSDVVEKKELFYRVAELYEQALGRRDRAIDTWKNVLTVDDEDAAGLDALERLYREAKEFRPLVEILQRKIELTPDLAARRPLHFAAAAVFDRELKDSFEAIAQYKAVLDANPTDGEALAALDDLHAREKQWHDLVEIIDRRAELERDANKQADLRHRAARVVEKELDEPAQAIERYKKILDATPRHAPTREALDALTKREDTLEAAADALEPVYKRDYLHDKLAELHERRLAVKADDPSARRERFAQLAETHEAGRGDATQAFQVWARFLAEEPEDVAAQGELERLAAAKGTWQELANLYEQILANTTDSQLARHYAMKLASVYEEALGNTQKAAQRYKQALEAGGDELQPLAALDRIYEREGKWPELAEILAKQASVVGETEEQASFLYRLGDVKERALRDPAGAVAAYRDVLERVPTHPAARAALERLLGNPAERAQVIAILEPIYENESDHGRLADLLDQKLTVENSASERAELLQRIAGLAEKQLGDKVRALDAVGRWLADDPTAEQAAAELERLAGELRRWEEAAARIADVVGSTKNADVQRDLSLRLGRILMHELHDASRAEGPYRRVLELEKRNEAALLALEEVCRALADPRKLADVLALRAEVELDAGQKRACWAEVGKLRERALNDDPGAIAAWKQVLDLDEADADAHVALAGIYERVQRWEDLVGVLELRARHAPDKNAEKVARRRMAEVLTEKLSAGGDFGRATDAWIAVADLDPEDDSALVALTNVHLAKKDWLAVQETLTRRLGLAEKRADKIAILLELARVAEVERKSIDEAVGYLHQILEVDNASADAYAGLERLYTASERWHDLIEVLVRLGDVKGTLGDNDAEIALLARAADVWEGPLANADAAAEILEKILKRDPRYVPALTRLARIYETAGEWEKCQQTLERALALSPSGRDAADLYFRLGKVAESQGAPPEKVLPAFEKALSFDGSHTGALAALEKAARDRGDWVAVAGLLTRRASLETEVPKRLAASMELADLYRTKLHQPAAALPFLEQAAQLAPDDATIMDALADLYFAAGRAFDAAPIYAKLAEKAKAARKPKDVAKYQQRMGLLAEAAGNVAEALRAYEEAFRIDPTSGATMAGLGRIYFGQGEWEKARRVYRSMLLQNLDPSVGVSKADVYLQLGLIHVKLGETPKAKSMFERGLELDAQHAGLKEAMAQLHG